MKMEESVDETNGKHENSVEITLKIIGPARPSRLHVPSSFRVHDLRKLVAGKNRLLVENLKLILRGKVLHDCEDEDDIYFQVNDGGINLGFYPVVFFHSVQSEINVLFSGFEATCIDFLDSLIVAVKPKAPTGLDNDDEKEDLLPQSTSRWKKKLY